MQDARLLVVNGNSSKLATSRIASYVAGAVPPGCTASVVQPARGPEGIDTALDATVAAVEVARTIAARHAGFDACVIACGVDPGLDAAREVCAVPVVGIAEAGMLAAAPLGQAYIVPVLSAGQVPAMRALAARYGMAARLTATPSVDTTAAQHFAAPETVFPALRDACAKELQGGDVVVLTGAAMAGLEVALAGELGVPVVCGLAAGIGLAALLARLDAPGRASARTPASPKPGAIRGYEDLHPFYGSMLPPAE